MTKTYTAKLIQNVTSKTTIQIEAKNKKEAKRKVAEQIEAGNIDWFLDKEQFNIEIK
jgi:hypothetical protein